MSTPPLGKEAVVYLTLLKSAMHRRSMQKKIPSNEN